MKTFSNTAFLCAYFSFEFQSDAEALLCQSGWKRVKYDNSDRTANKNYFYPEFVDFTMGDDTNAAVRKFAMEVHSTIRIYDVDVFVKEIQLNLMPYGIALYCVETCQESDSLNDFTLAVFGMREMRRWDTAPFEAFRESVCVPIRKVKELLGNHSGEIVENGNKLKVFQIVTTQDAGAIGESPDITLFELGTLGRIGGCAEQNPDSPSADYIARLLNESRISFYNNWKGLALFDTFTILGYDVRPWVLDTWKNDYFGKIYIHSLFCKFYLFRLNARFRSTPGQGEELEREYNEFDRMYTFHRISYNFLPGEIDAAIDKGLEISEEKRLLKGYITEYNKEKADESSTGLNKMLNFLAIVTVLSTIWDFSCMVNAMWPFGGFDITEPSGYRIVVSLTLLFMVLAIISMFRGRKK